MQTTAIRRSVLVLFFLSAMLTAGAQGASGYKLAKKFPIASGGGWDYIAVNDHRIYVAHATQTNILDESTGDSLGYIPNTTGVHGVAFIPQSGKGYISCGRLNTVVVFDLKTNAVLEQIPVGQNPDAIMYDPFTKRIITCNGRSNDLSLIDPATNKVVSTIPVPGKPETAVTDGAGKIFVNIEDKNSISAVDAVAGKVISTWSLNGAEGPTGLVIDTKTKRLFAGCEKKLVVLDYTSGKVLQQLPIGDGCDGVAFDPELHFIFASCGEGVLDIAREDQQGNCKMIDRIPSKRSGRTITVDPANHEVFIPAADLGTAAAGQRPPVIPGTFQILVFSR